MKKLLSILMVVALLITLAPVQTASAAIKISQASASMYVDETLQLEISGTSKKVTWSSSKNAVAAVSSKGKVTAVSVGTAKITAKVGSKTYDCKVIIKKDEIVTVTVTNMLSNDEITNYLSTIDIIETVVNDDYTTTYTMKKSSQKLILDYLYSLFNGNDLSALPSYYYSVDISDDITEFVITVDKEEYMVAENDLTLFGLLILSGGYQQFSGVKDEDVKFSVQLIDKDTQKVFESYDKADLIE